jgi:hypothetical protein
VPPAGAQLAEVSSGRNMRRRRLRWALIAVGSLVVVWVLIYAIQISDEFQEVGVDHASGVTQGFAEKRARPGEELQESGCWLVYPSDEDQIRCDARYSSGRGYVLDFRRIKGGEELKLERLQSRRRLKRSFADEP